MLGKNYKAAWWEKYELDILDLYDDAQLPKGHIDMYNKMLWEEASKVCDEQIRVKIIQRKAGLTSDALDAEIANLDKAKQYCKDLLDEQKPCSLCNPRFAITFSELERAIVLAYGRVPPPITLIAMHDRYKNLSTINTGFWEVL